MSKRSLLDKWLNRQKPEAAIPPPAPAAGPYPLSTGQERLWVLSQLSPDNAFYNYAERYNLYGPLDAERLRRAFTEVIRRHAILRTVFRSREGSVRQLVREEPDFAWRYSPDPVTEAEAIREAKRPFDLEKGPLTRVLVSRQGAALHQLVITQHHIITDKWSMRILCEEVAAAYRDPAAVPPPLAVQFGEFAARQRNALSQASLEFWREKLADAPPLLELPTDYSRPAQQSYRGRFAYRTVEDSLAGTIRQRCREESVTAYVYLLSAYLVLLYRHTGQSDLLVGTPVSNRDTLDLERLIGFFNETLVLRNGLRRDMTFAELLVQVQSGVMEAFAHKQVSFDEVVKVLNPARTAGVNPLFQAMFILYEVPATLDITPELHLAVDPLDLGTTKFDLTLAVADRGAGYQLVFEYATDLFAPARIAGMLEQYVRILRQVTERPALPIGKVELVTATELAGAADAPRLEEQYVDRLILDAAVRAPDHQAVVAGTQRLTYAELDHRSAALAGRLVERGAQPGSVVGLHVGRGVDALVGLLGILRCGAAYLPLDPAYPAERRQFMLTDSGASLVVTDGSLAGEAASVEVVELREATEGGDAPPPELPVRSWDDPAYLIYTSGSSGQPKAVAVSHRNLLHSNAARAAVYGGAPASFLLLSSFSFDSSVAGIFWTLCGGGTLVVSELRAEQDPAALGTTIHREKVTHTLMLPTLYRQLLEFARPADLTSLRTVIVAGEACTPATVRAHFGQLPATRLFNEYGPTEATVWATAHEVTAADADGAVPIGRAVPYYRAVLTDPAGLPVPDGVTGELCIAGAGLTAGYHNRPALTAERFRLLDLPDGERLPVYRTGDLAQRRADGALLFLGRADRQVKVRGYRVELGEVKRYVADEPDVREAEVVVSADGNRLLAYVTLAPGAAGDGLSERLRQRMPAYLLPGRVIVLDDFPRLPNGKVDQRRLANSEEKPTTPSAVPDRTGASATEQRLLAIWEEVLGLAAVGLDDNFFALGGDSILSIRILSRARRAGIRLPATAIFDRQTVRELAAVATLEQARASAGGVYHGPVPLTPIQHWFFAEHRAAPHFWNHAWLIDLPAGADTERFERGTQALFREQEALRLQFDRSETGIWTARIAPPEAATPFRRDQMAGPPTDDELLAFQAGVRLDQDPLFQVRVSESPAGTRVLVWAHHLVVDVVSWDKLLAVFTGEPAPGGAPYHLWARQLGTWADAGRFAAQLPFWEHQRIPPIPTDRPGRLPVAQSSVRVVSRQATAEVTEALLQEANEPYGTRAEELILTAVLRAVRPYAGDRIGINMERHGREVLDGSLDVGETVGWFTTSYPLELRIGGQEVGEDIITVKETLRSVPEQGIGYGVLRYLAGHHSLDQHPELYVNYLGQASGSAPNDAPRFVTGGLRAPNGEVNRTWEINAQVREGRLVVDWSYSTELHHPATVEGLSDRVLEQLTALVDHCRAAGEKRFTPSDFPEASLSQDDLDGLLDQLNF